MKIQCLNCEGQHLVMVDRYKAVLPFSDRYFSGNIVRCQDCGLHFLDSSPGIVQLKEFYSRVYRKEGARHHQVDPGRQSKSFNPWARAYAFWELLGRYTDLSSLHNIADVGAGWGYFLLASREMGAFNCVAVETDDHAGAFLRANGFTVVPQLIEEIEREAYHEKFDVVALSHVLEHSTQPKVMLRQIWDMLKPGCFAIIEVPNEDFSVQHRALRSNDAPHAVFFSRDTLQGMLDRCGFKVHFCQNAGRLRMPAVGRLRRPAVLNKLIGGIRSRVLVHVNPRWANPEMFQYCGDRVYIRALVSK